MRLTPSAHRGYYDVMKIAIYAAPSSITTHRCSVSLSLDESRSSISSDLFLLAVLWYATGWASNFNPCYIRVVAPALKYTVCHPISRKVYQQSTSDHRSQLQCLERLLQQSDTAGSRHEQPCSRRKLSYDIMLTAHAHLQGMPYLMPTISVGVFQITSQLLLHL